MPKSTTPDQHNMLHLMWPRDCCLCGHEARIAVLEAKYERLREVLARRMSADGHLRQSQSHAECKEVAEVLETEMS